VLAVASLVKPVTKDGVPITAREAYVNNCEVIATNMQARKVWLKSQAADEGRTSVGKFFFGRRLLLVEGLGASSMAVPAISSAV